MIPESTELANIKATVREMIAHEDSQINRRITWLCQLQGFLFASLGFSWDKSHRLSIVLAVLGIAVALLVLTGLIAATLELRRVRKYWLTFKPDDHEGPDILGFFPSKVPFTAFMSPDNLLPLVLVAGWIFVLTCV